MSDDGKCLVYASRPFGCRTFFCEREKIILASHARRLHCCLNSPAALCNLLVSLAAGACFEIVEPITGKNQVRMRVAPASALPAMHGI